MRYDYSDLLRFGTALFEATGLSEERSTTMASTFLEADLLGFTTHGMNRIAHNLRWLEQGVSRKEGEPQVLTETSNVFNWDANFLPGPWVVSQAIEQCIAKVKKRRYRLGNYSPQPAHRLSRRLLPKNCGSRLRRAHHLLNAQRTYRLRTRRYRTGILSQPSCLCRTGTRISDSF